MELPDQSDWLFAKDVAEKYGKTASAVYLWRTKGRQALNGKRVKLQMWSSPSGLVTTKEALRRFYVALNQV